MQNACPRKQDRPHPGVHLFMREHSIIERDAMTELQPYYTTADAIGEFNAVTARALTFFGRPVFLYDVLMGWWERRSNNDLIAMIDPADPPRAVLEMGVGTGNLLGQFVHRFPDARVVGVDLSTNMLRAAHSSLVAGRLDKANVARFDRLPPLNDAPDRWPARVTLARADALNLPLDDGTFDGIVSSFLLDLLSPAETRRAVGEMARLLRPGARAWIATLNNRVDPARSLPDYFVKRYFRRANWWYGQFYRSPVARTLSKWLFRGYYTHSRPIDLAHYVAQCDTLTIRRHTDSFIRIAGVPFVPVRIVELVRS